MKIVLLLLIWNSQAQGESFVATKFDMVDVDHCEREGAKQVERLKAQHWDYVNYTCVVEAK
ncbi:hypothetical protein SmphiM6_74 [Sinorhizobium phage phiM6]|nr:hypothetical protein SmphiM6_74 [Sinorhizobium phage phiM6]